MIKKEEGIFYTWPQMVQHYRGNLERTYHRRFNINKWVNLRINPLEPSDLVTILGSTGIGKTFIAQSLCMATKQPIMFIELEISKALLTKRYLGMLNGMSPWHIERMMVHGEDFAHEGLEHVVFLNITSVTPEIIRVEIDNCEKELKVRPAIVIIDYFQLMGCGGGNRYESASYAAEKLRVIARQKDLIIIALSQISRGASRREDGEVDLFDAKESGSIENSSSLVLSIFKKPKKKNSFIDALDNNAEEDDPTAYVKVLKYSHGRAGYIATVELDWEKMEIRQI